LAAGEDGEPRRKLKIGLHWDGPWRRCRLDGSSELLMSLPAFAVSLAGCAASGWEDLRIEEKIDYMMISG